MTDDPKIKLGGVEYVIPKLALKQCKVIEPLVSRNLAFFKTIKDRLVNASLLNLTQQEVDDFTAIVHASVTRAKPDLTYAQFEELPISMTEIMMALPTCVKQTGFFQQATSGEANGAPPPGEAPRPSTGTTSSPA